MSSPDIETSATGTLRSESADLNSLRLSATLMGMKHTIMIFLTSLAVSAAVAGCGDNTDDNSTNLRFLNAVVGVGSVDMLVDTDEYLEEVAYLESTEYLEFDTDPHLLQITPSNSLTPIDTQRVSLQDDVDYTYIACGDSSEPDAILLEDDNEPAGDDSFKARIINVFRGARGFDVFITANPDNVDNLQPTARRLGYRAATSYRAARAGIYDIVVRNTTTGTIVATLPGQDFQGENVYSVLLVADEDEPSDVQVLVLADRDVNS
jgi:hypothetical protein